MKFDRGKLLGLLQKVGGRIACCRGKKKNGGRTKPGRIANLPKHSPKVGEFGGGKGRFSRGYEIKKKCVSLGPEPETYTSFGGKKKRIHKGRVQPG